MTKSESQRIIKAGGRIYQTKTTQIRNIEKEQRLEKQLGPYRVLPGRLSVSRTIGDPDAKLLELGGNPSVVIPTPEIKAFKIAPNYDYIIIGSDGIFDKTNNKEIIHNAWQSINSMPKSTVHQVSGRIVETVVSLALRKRSMDNVTVVVIALSNLKKIVKRKTSVVINA